MKMTLAGTHLVDAPLATVFLQLFARECFIGYFSEPSN